ncbi:MAG: hypothetical protein U9N85_09230 [Bacteroidota bacterium]|nr:hypothetical protein [Bacteroidota bacterium]
MDIIIRKFFALLIPWGLANFLKLFSSASGAAAITDILEDIGGPWGMSGGIGVLILIALLTDAVIGRLFYLKFKRRVQKMKDENTDRDKIIDHISSRGLYSRSLRYRILMRYAAPKTDVSD